MADDAPGGATPPDPVKILPWLRSADLPPFVATDVELMGELRGVIEGTSQPGNPIDISEALAAQIYLLFGKGAPLGEYKCTSYYELLASLALGTRAAPDAAVAKRLHLLLARQIGSHTTGIVPALRYAVKNRGHSGRLAKL